jgi:NitT/TauT family transport system ATP-binding protein
MGDVTLHDISKQFRLRVDGTVHVVQALSRVSFKVDDGEIVVLIGPSGCGKTTALRIAMGLETASGGKVTVDGREVRGCGHDRGMVFQFAELLPWLTALQNVMFGLEMKGMRGAELRATATRYLELVGLSDSLNRRPHQLRRDEAARRHRPRARHRPQGPAHGRAVRLRGTSEFADTRYRVWKALHEPVRTVH